MSREMGKWNTQASTICSSWTQASQVGKCPQRRSVCWAWVLPQLDYLGWAQPDQVGPGWSSREVKNAELLLAVVYQRQLWPTVGLALDPAQNVSLLHRSPHILLPAGPGFIPIESKNDRDAFVFDSPECAVKAQQRLMNTCLCSLHLLLHLFLPHFCFQITFLFLLFF